MQTRPFQQMMFARPRRGFTIVELIVVIAIIALLIALLLPALKIAKANSQWATSQSNLRQIATLMQGYTSDNRDRVLPSAFDHRAPLQFKGPMRAKMTSTPGSLPTLAPPIGTPLVGTWADILWTTANLGTLAMPEMSGGDLVPDTSGFYNYRFDSPDRLAYTAHPNYSGNILRSTTAMKKPISIDPTSEALPWGNGASEREIDHPGYFAANNFFTSAPWLGAGATGIPAAGQMERFVPSGQILFPSAAVYLVDSRAGETIEPVPMPWAAADTNLCEIDFRYPGETCLFLCMDGHVQTEPKWEKIEDLQGGYFTSPASPPPPGANDPDPRGLKISNLDRADNPGP